MHDFIAAATNLPNIIAMTIAVLVFATVLTLAAPVFKGDKLEGRMKAVGARREELRRASRAAIGAGRDASAALRRTDESLYKKIVEQLNLSKLLEDPKVVDKLAQAGMRGPGPLSRFYFARFSTPFVLAAGAGVWSATQPHMQPIQRICVVVIGFVAGFYAPNLYLSNRIQKRRESIMQAFPDALDLLLICVEAGMSIEAAVQKVASEIGTRSIELAEELSLLTAELSYLPERRQAYEGLAKRTNHPGIKAVAVAMTQAERYGTPLGNALRVMAKENREMRIAAAEKKAAQLPAKLTVPMVIFFLPVLFIVILTPGLMKAFDSQKHSQQQQRIEKQKQP